MQFKAPSGPIRVTTSIGHRPDRYGDDSKVYTDTEAMLADMRNPLYAKSESFRRSVALKLARSSISEVSDADAGNGFYATQTIEQLNNREKSEAEIAHEQRMIRKASEAGV